jgi:hypothetical protein
MLCNFGQVFSHDLRCWACGNRHGHHISLSVRRKPPCVLSWGLGDGFCRFV